MVCLSKLCQSPSVDAFHGNKPLFHQSVIKSEIHCSLGVIQSLLALPSREIHARGAKVSKDAILFMTTFYGERECFLNALHRLVGKSKTPCGQRAQAATYHSRALFEMLIGSDELSVIHHD